jgi:hypothetical protein
MFPLLPTPLSPSVTSASASSSSPSQEQKRKQTTKQRKRGPLIRVLSDEEKRLRNRQATAKYRQEERDTIARLKANHLELKREAGDLFARNSDLRTANEALWEEASHLSKLLLPTT